MNADQLKELLQIVNRAGMTRVAAKFLQARLQQDGDGQQPTGILPTIRSLFGSKDRANVSGESEHDRMARSREELQARIDQGEVISYDKVKDLPSSHLPAGLADWRAQQRVAEIIRSELPDKSGPAPAFDPKQPGSGPSPERNWQKPTGDREPVKLEDVINGAVLHQDSGQGGPQQPETPGPQGSERSREPSKASNAMDALQLVLDGIGVLDPTPITDGANAAISVGRAFITDPERRKEHLQNAAISAVSMVPYAGDTAKLAKLPRAAKTVQRTNQAVRGGSRTADAGVTAAQKRAARQRYRETTEQIVGAPGRDEREEAMEATASPQGPVAPTGGNGGTRVPPSGLGSPDGGDGPGLNQTRETTEGVEKYDEWREKVNESAGKLADFAGALGKGVAKAAAFTQGLSLLNTGVLALNRELAPYSGELATAYARADAADIRRDMRKVQALSGSLSGLSSEQTELKDKLDEVVVPLQKVGIEILTMVTRLTNEALDFMGGVIKVVPGLEKAIALYQALNHDQQDPGTAWNQFFQDVSDGKFDGQRPRFSPHGQQILNDQDDREVFGP